MFKECSFYIHVLKIKGLKIKLLFNDIKYFNVYLPITDDRILLIILILKFSRTRNNTRFQYP